MKKLPIIFFISVLIVETSIAQSSILQSTAVNEALGNSSATLSNYGSMNANIAGLAGINEISVAASYRMVPKAIWQNSFSFIGVIPFKIATAGVGFSSFGDDVFNQQLISLGVSNRFGIASIGLKANYLQYNIEGINNNAIAFFDLGGIVELTPQLFIGAYILNLTQTKLASFQNEHYPTIIDAGLSYRPSDKLIINIEIEEDIDFDPTFKAGIEYKPIKNFSVRTGINTTPNRQFFGVGFIPNNILLNIDYALSHDQYFGFQHQMSVSYSIKKRNDEKN